LKIENEGGSEVAFVSANITASVIDSVELTFANIRFVPKLKSTKTLVSADISGAFSRFCLCFSKRAKIPQEQHLLRDSIKIGIYFL
jgi:hypothetical protein